MKRKSSALKELNTGISLVQRHLVLMLRQKFSDLQLKGSVSSLSQPVMSSRTLKLAILSLADSITAARKITKLQLDSKHRSARVSKSR